MPRGKAKSRFNFNEDEKTGKLIGCEFENSTWCNLPKYKRCEDCMRLKGGGKACYITCS